MNRQKLNRLNKLAEKIGNGNREETNQAFEEMMGIYKDEFRLIINFWAQQKNYSLDRDDLIQIASVTLFQTAVKWNNSNRGRDFACYVNPAIRAALIRATSEDAPIRVPYGSQQNKRAKRQKKKGQDKIICDSVERIKSQDNSWVEGTTKSPMEIVLEREQENTLYAALQRLPEMDREIVMRHYGINHKKESYSEIAKNLGVTKQCINYRQSRIFARLKDILCDELQFDSADILAMG